MTTLELQGRITESGDLEIKLPAGLPAGEVTVRIEVPETPESTEDEDWTEEELSESIRPEPTSGREIAALLQQMEPIEFVNPEIADPVEWTETQRRKEMDRLKPHWNTDK